MNSIKEQNHNGIYLGLLILLILSIILALVHTFVISPRLNENILFAAVGSMLVGVSLLLYFVSWLSSSKYLKNGIKSNFYSLTLLLAVWALAFLSYFVYTAYTLIFNEQIDLKLGMLTGVLFFIILNIFKETFTFLKKQKGEFDRLQTLEDFY